MSTLAHPLVRRDPATGRTVELWLDPSVQDVIDRLRNGDSAVGWEGDWRLALYLELLPGHREPTWVLQRLEDDGEYRVVCRSKPGAELRNLPRVLVEHDRQRGYDLAADLATSSAKAEAARDARMADVVADKLDRIVWAVNRDTHDGALEGRTVRSVSAAARRLGH